MPEGLVQQATAEEAPAPATGEEANLTPEEQETYDSAMQMVSSLIYEDDKSHDSIMQIMAEEDPVAGTASAAMFLMSKIEETFQGQYPEELILTTTDEITDLLLELANEAGLFEVTEQIANQVKLAAVEELAEEYGVDPADIEANLGDITQEDVSKMDQMFGGQNA